MIAKVIIVMIFGALAWQDFKYRLVSVWLLLALGILGAYRFYYSLLSWMELLLNIGYVTVFVILTTLVIKVRGKQIKEMLGAGDIVFWYLLTPFYFLEELAILMVMILSLSLMAHLVLTKMNLVKTSYIPLIGYMGVFVIVEQLIHW